MITGDSAQHLVERLAATERPEIVRQQARFAASLTRHTHHTHPIRRQTDGGQPRLVVLIFYE